MERTTVRLGPQGRLVIPSALRQVLGLSPGDELIAFVEDRHLVLATRAALLEEIREHVTAVVPEGVSLVDELLAERRDEFRREDEEMRREEEAGRGRGAA